MNDDNKHMAEVTITWDPQRKCYWLDDIVAIPEDMFEAVFGFEPSEGSYEIEFTLNHKYDFPSYDDCGRVMD